jgi:hypothetical protein
MKRVLPLAVLSVAAIALLVAPPPASAAVSGFRGIVVDEQGQPIEGVESRSRPWGA